MIFDLKIKVIMTKKHRFNIHKDIILLNKPPEAYSKIKIKGQRAHRLKALLCINTTPSMVLPSIQAMPMFILYSSISYNVMNNKPF